MNKSLNRRRFVCLSLGGFVFAPRASARTNTRAELQSVNVFSFGSRTYIELKFSEPVSYRYFSLGDPERLVVDLSDTIVTRALEATKVDNPLVEEIRSGRRRGGRTRVVFDLAQPIKLLSNGWKGSRLLFEFRPFVASAPDPAKPQRPLVVVIDPGHGGKDPGAIGNKYKEKEKDIVLAISHKLFRRLQGEPLIKAYMTRKDDTYISLRERLRIGSRHNADLFVSIHADAFRLSSARGSSVYARSLRNKASSEAAAWLAEQQNKVDQVYGSLRLSEDDPLLNQTLVELAQEGTIGFSIKMGEKILDSIGKVNRLHKKHVEQAAFVVLKSPDIPSVLVETAFISNPAEEKKLRTKAHQEKLSKSIHEGLMAYINTSWSQGIEPSGSAGTLSGLKNKA